MAIRTREQARAEILRVANRQIAWRNKKFGQRHIHQAVCVVRRLGLINNTTLVMAGFNPRKERGS